MIISLTNVKGGVGKTTLAVHLAQALTSTAPTLLIDGDPHRSALGWAEKGLLSCTTIDEKSTARHARNFDQIVIDSAAHPSAADLKAMSENSDLLLIISECDTLSLRATIQAVKELEKLKLQNYAVVLNSVPPNSHAGDDAREALASAGVPVLKAQVRSYAVFRKAALLSTTVERVRDDYSAEAAADIKNLLKEVKRHVEKKSTQ